MSAEDEGPLLAPLAVVHDPRPGERIGEYQIESLLGEGGMATVFAAIHPLIHKRAAVKVLSRRLCSDPHAVERFVQEARTVNEIGHPNIVDVFAFGTMPDGRSYFVMEWLPGETLAARLEREALPFETSLSILVQVGEALKAAHQKQIVHRDLKPDNVYLVDGRGPNGGPMVKLLDFGVAKLADSDVTVPRTRSGVAIGTAGYMSPEQARARPVDARTDIYALGAMAYEMFCGRLPFVGESAIDILAQHLTEPPPPPRMLWRDIPRPLERLILRMLEKSADDRPDADYVRAELDKLRELAVPPPPRSPKSDRSLRRWSAPRTLLTFGAIMGIAGFAAFAGLRMRHRSAAFSPTAARASAPVVAPLKAPAPVVAPRLASTGAPTVAPATLIVRVGLPDATIKLDGRRIAERAPEARIEVAEPGNHRVEVSAPGRARFSREVFIGAGATVELPVHLAAERPKSPAPARPKPHGDYTLNPFE